MKDQIQCFEQELSQMTIKRKSICIFFYVINNKIVIQLKTKFYRHNYKLTYAYYISMLNFFTHISVITHNLTLFKDIN